MLEVQDFAAIQSTNQDLTLTQETLFKYLWDTIIEDIESQSDRSGDTF